MRARDYCAVAAAVVTVLLTARRGRTVSLTELQRLRTHSHAAVAADAEWDLVSTPGPLITAMDGINQQLVAVVDGQLHVGSTVIALPQPRFSKHMYVALATGFLSADHKHQHIVVVRDDWTVLCYNANLTVLWQRTLDHYDRDVPIDATAAERHPRLFAINQVAVTVLPYAVTAGDTGVVIVGGTLRQRHADAAADSTARQHAKAAAQHFALYAMEGLTGAERWRHTSSSSNSNSSSCLQFSESLLRHLPHSWSGPEDTRMQTAYFERSSSSNSSRSSSRQQRLLDRRSSKRRRPAAVRQPTPNVVLAYSQQGIEAVALTDGLPVCTLPLGSAGAGPLAHADLNADGVMEHVQSIERSWHTPAPCHAVVSSGESYDTYKQLFIAELCTGVQQCSSSHSSIGAAAPLLLPRRDSRSSSSRSSSSAVMDAVFAVSCGAVSSFDHTGKLNWRVQGGPRWHAPANPAARDCYTVLLEARSTTTSSTAAATASAAAGATSSITQLQQEQMILVTGQAEAAVYARSDGRLLGRVTLPEPPAQRPVIGDVNNDGTADVVLVGADWVTVFAVQTSVVSSSLLGCIVLLLVAAMVGAAVTAHATKADPSGQLKRGTDI
jgi:hypothetical protein